MNKEELYGLESCVNYLESRCINTNSDFTDEDRSALKLLLNFYKKVALKATEQQVVLEMLKSSGHDMEGFVIRVPVQIGQTIYLINHDVKKIYPAVVDCICIERFASDNYIQCSVWSSHAIYKFSELEKLIKNKKIALSESDAQEIIKQLL